ncbi:MAG TPA: anti-sigma factor [Elusimicrobiota bacterium]|nr:anti-sigma factor [Elusimicrobiota bacterium]
MRCEEASELLGALADGELEPARRAAAEAHLSACAACAGRLRALRGLSSAVRAEAPYHRAPADLRARVERALRGSRGPALSSWRARVAPGLAGAAVGFACALFALRAAPPASPPLDEAVSEHIRAMLSDRLVTVESSDHHTVKPWFSRHVDFSPPVPDLAASGFPLKGGRVEPYGGRPAAVSVYARGRHVIDVFTWPEPGADTSPSLAVEQRGYHVLSWRTGSFGYRAVSDLNARELTEFAERLSRAAASNP